MPDFNEIIANGKGDHLVFIPRTDDWFTIAKTLVAFANSGGGKLLIGVKGNGKIVGVSPQEVSEVISEISNGYCKPAVVFTIKTREMKHHLIVEIEVLKSKDKYRSIDKDKSWNYYIRSGNQNFQGNKILENVWNLEKFGSKNDESIFESEKEILNNIKVNQPVTLSYLYKISMAMRSEVDKILANLVFQKQVIMKVTGNGTFYSVSEEVNILL